MREKLTFEKLCRLTGARILEQTDPWYTSAAAGILFDGGSEIGRVGLINDVTVVCEPITYDEQSEQIPSDESPCLVVIDPDPTIHEGVAYADLPMASFEFLLND